jgi:flagellar motor protein MotB
MKNLLTLTILILSLSGCVSKKKYAALESEVERLRIAEPIQKATEQTEQLLIEDMKQQVQQLQDQLASSNRTLEKFQMLEDATSIPQPTPEQMEAYRLQHDQDMQERENRMIKEDQESALTAYYIDKSMDLRVIEAGCEQAIDGYKPEQVQLTLEPGQLDVSIANDELFDENKKALNANGISLLNKLAVAINGRNQVPFYIVVTDEERSLSIERGLAIQDFLGSLEVSSNAPKGTGVTSCREAIGVDSKDCDRTVLRFRPDYNEVIEYIDRAQLR